MFRYSTATIKYKIISTIDFTQIDDIWVTLCNEFGTKKTWKLSKTEITVDNTDKVISLALSQEDTALFKDGIAETQLRILDKSGNASASKIKKLEFSRVLEEGVISV